LRCYALGRTLRDLVFSTRLIVGLIALGLAVIVAGAILVATGRGVDVDLERSLGDDVACEEAGMMVFLGERERFWRCTHEDGEPAGCWVKTEGEIYDVSAAVGCRSS